MRGLVRALRTRVGHMLVSHDMFKDELPDEEDRVRILEYLREHPSEVEGVVDVATGLICRASLNLGRRLLSYGLIIGTAILVAALAASGWHPPGPCAID